jgi:MFS family permease
MVAREAGAAILDTRPLEAEAGYPRPAYAWYVVAVIFLANAFGFVDRIVVSILTPAIQAEFDLSDSQAGLLQGMAFALFYTLFGLPMGWLADRWNRKRLLSIGVTVWSVMTASCGTMAGFGSLFLARMGVGIGEATLNPCAVSLIGDYFPSRTRARAFGVYVMGTTAGTAFTYLFGGFLLDALAARGGLDLPVLGHLEPWQAMFVLVGAPGLIPAALLLLSVREPPRREIAMADRAGASMADIRTFVRQNRMTLLCHHLGITLVVMTVYGFVNWMPTFFLRVHGWQPQQFAQTYGFYALFAGVFSAVSSGWLATWFKDRGYADGTLRACVIGCAGCVLIGGVTAPLMPDPSLSLLAFIITAIFANYPSVLGLTSIAEIVPNQMRGTVTAVYTMMIGLVSSGLGPFAVGLLTDHVFGDRAAIGQSIVALSVLAGVPGVLLLAFGLRFYRASLARAALGR